MEKMRPNGQRAKIAMMLIWTVLTIEIISILSDYLQYDLLQTVANGDQISTETATGNDLRQKIIAIIYFLVNMNVPPPCFIINCFSLELNSIVIPAAKN